MNYKTADGSGSLTVIPCFNQNLFAVECGGKEKENYWIGKVEAFEVSISIKDSAKEPYDEPEVILTPILSFEKWEDDMFSTSNQVCFTGTKENCLKYIEEKTTKQKKKGKDV